MNSSCSKVGSLFHFVRDPCKKQSGVTPAVVCGVGVSVCDSDGRQEQAHCTDPEDFS